MVTGASGFVGRAVVTRLEADGDEVIAIGGARSATPSERVRTVARLDLNDSAGWDEPLAGADAIVHTAARVHRLDDDATDPLQAYRDVNVEGTRMLAEASVRAGIRRFVFISSIKVNGETTEGRAPFSADETPAPKDPYAVSKLEAEQALFRIGREFGLEAVAIRPPLVYGPGVKANFRTMIKLSKKGWPLPLGRANGRRSLLALDNLVDLIAVCLRNPDAPGHVFLASDGVDLSVAEMLRGLARALGRPARLIPLPPRMLRFAATLAGKHDVAMRLLAPLQVDMEPTRRILNWSPPVSLDQALRQATEPFRDGARS